MLYASPSHLTSLLTLFFFTSQAFLYVYKYEPMICGTIACIVATDIDSSALSSGFIKIDM